MNDKYTAEQVESLLELNADWMGKSPREILRDYAALLRERESAKAAVTDEPVVIEEVGRVEFNGTGDLDINWSIEGGIHAIGAGTILLVPDRKVTDDEGYGELYVAPILASARVPDEIPLELCAPISVEWMAHRTGYREGWNDCRKAMLAATPKPEKE